MLWISERCLFYMAIAAGYRSIGRKYWIIKSFLPSLNPSCVSGFDSRLYRIGGKCSGLAIGKGVVLLSSVVHDTIQMNSIMLTPEMSFIIFYLLKTRLIIDDCFYGFLLMDMIEDECRFDIVSYAHTI